MNYVFVNNAEPKTKSVSRSSSTGKSQKLEQYEKQYLSRLEKEPTKEETKKVSSPRRVQSKKPKSASELEKYEKRYLDRLEKQSQTNEIVQTRNNTLLAFNFKIISVVRSNRKTKGCIAKGV